MPTADQVRAGNELYERAPAWRASYELLCQVFRSYPEIDYLPLVQMNVCLVNRVYWTRLWAEQKMAEHLVGKTRILTGAMRNGNPAAIELIGITDYAPDTTFWSFATKFCHFQNPDSYPMYDTHVRCALGVGCAKRGIEWYQQFTRSVLDAIQSTGCRFSFAGIDRYCWLKGQKNCWSQLSDQFSREVHLLRQNYPGIWKRL